MQFFNRFIPVALIAFCCLIFSSCGKDNTCDSADPAREEAAIKAFLQQNGINGTKHPRGFYYEILSPGSLSKPLSTSTVYVTYKGTLLDGTEFDAQANPGLTGFRLNGTIEGWQIAVPLIGKGGNMKIVLPSSLGYGCAGSGTKIPSNSPLYFEIALVDFFN